MTKRHIIALLALPALALAACHKTSASGDAPSVDAAALKAAAATPAPPGGWTAMVAETPEGGYRMGNPNAPVKIVEYGSRTCPHCAAFAAEGAHELESKYVSTGKVSYEYRDFAIHAPDLAAILLGRCNGAGSYFPILDQMYVAQPAVLEKLQALPTGFEEQFQGKTPTEQARIWADYLGYIAFVGQRGVPRAKAEACLADAKAIDRLSAQMDAGVKKYDVTGTPAFIINEEPQGLTVGEWRTLEPRIRAVMGS